MPKERNTRALRIIRHARIRRKVSGTPDRPRLSVFRSLKNITAQIIDDSRQETLVAASTLEKDMKGVKKKSKTELSKLVGINIAKRAVDKGISKVVFDRGGYQFHGRVKALAEAAREEGLSF
ncbi:50S ribosomal protein L18 [SAR202 cluster bacterium AD-804-J14_MRT_500m]|nr:50S ribosomal protein L18 [SAR202 cluster bacterium AD-804-J14_MRT_500m]